jgi:predicted alpha/beta hydrolase family esterase
MSYVLIHHGWTNTRQPDHWQRNLAHALRLQGHHVSYAQYPETQQPNFDEWSALLVAELEHLVELRELSGDRSAELILVAHSLGCVNIMKSALEGLIGPQLRANRTLLVAPAGQEKLDAVPTFRFELESTEAQAELRAALANFAGDVTLVASEDDVWLPKGIRAEYADPLGLEPVIIKGGQHLSLQDGWGKWQGVIDWVNDSAADLRVR